LDVEALDFEALLEASTLASPTVEQIRRHVPSEVRRRVQERLADRPADPVPDADTAVLQLVRMCRTDQQPNPYVGVLRLLLDRDALADVHPEVAQEIVAVAFTGASNPPPAVADTCLAVLDKGRLGEDLASRFALLLRKVAPQRSQPRLYPGGHVDFGGVGPGALAAWFRLLRLTLFTVPLVLVATVGFVVGLAVGLQLRPERWLGALACVAGTVVAGGFGLRWSRRRLARWRAHASPR
jgi:hypothetical protein